MSLALWLIAYMLLAFAIGKLYELTIGWAPARAVFFPGMLVAGVGRLLACLVSGQSTKEADLMRKRGPTTSRGVPGGVAFRFLYASLPFTLALAVFVTSWHALGEPLALGQQLPQLPFEEAALEQGADVVSTQVTSLYGALQGFSTNQLMDWRPWAFLYCGFALIVASAPTTEDLFSIALFAGIFGGAVLALQQAGVAVAAEGVYRGYFWEGFSFLVGMAGFVFATSAVVLFPLKFFGSSKKKK